MESEEPNVESSYIIHKSVMPLFLRFIIIEMIMATIFYLSGLMIVLFGNIFNSPNESLYWWLIFIVVFIHLAGSVYLMYSMLNLVNEFYVLKPATVIRRQGVFSTREDIFNTQLIKVIDVRQKYLGQLFDYGDVAFSENLGGEEFVMKGISQPYKYEEIIKKFNKNFEPLVTQIPPISDNNFE